MDKGEELQEKYQRLGAEYQKTRAQVTVLKKAVIDEQAINRTLQDAVKQRDQSIRKYEQDIDSLQFRNSQLAKRVEVLQSDLDRYERRGTKANKQSNGQSTSVNFIHEQELQLKISENESLHKQLQEAHQQNQQVVRHLEARLEILEKDKENYERAVEECTNKSNSIVERMKEEHHIIECKVHKYEEELKIANIMTDKYKQQLKVLNEELKSKLDQTTKLMQEKIPFMDTENASLNQMNLPVCDRSHQHKSQMILDVITNHLVMLLASMSDYHTYLEQRVQAYSMDMKQESLSAVNMKYSQHLLSNAIHSRKVQRAAKSFQEQAGKEAYISLDTISSYKILVQSFKQYVKYLDKILPYRALSLEEECHTAAWSESLEKCNKNLLKHEKRIDVLFQKLATYINNLGQNDTSPDTFAVFVRNLCAILASLSYTFNGLLTIYTDKANEEHNIPTYTQRLKTTDECLIATLHSLDSSSSKIYVAFKENLDFMTAEHSFKRKGLTGEINQNLAPVLKEFHSKTANYLDNLKKERPRTVPYDLAIKNYRVVVNSSDNFDTYAKQVASTQESLTKLEQEKEHWMLEAQLVKAKLEKEMKKTAILGEELRKTKSDILNRSTSVEDKITIDFNQQNSKQDKCRSAKSSLSSTPDTPVHPVPFGQVDVFSKDKSNTIDTEHENLVKEHLTSRIAQLTKQLQFSDSKCISFYHEAHSLYKQIILADKSKQKITGELNESNRKIELLQDELETTKKSYEEQLRMLSDHLCGMNEKLTSQKDEIDVLKTAGNAPKGNKFGRKK